VKRVKNIESECQKWNEGQQTRIILVDKIPGDEINLVIATIHHILLQMWDDVEVGVDTTTNHHAPVAEIVIATTRRILDHHLHADAATVHHQMSSMVRNLSQPVATPTVDHAVATITNQRRMTTAHADTAASKIKIGLDVATMK
jgi:hypothetical protein